MTKIFSRKNKIFSRFSGSSLALFSSMTWPATENSLSQSVEVGGGVRNCLASLQRARLTLHSLPFSSKIFHQARQLLSNLAFRNLFRISSSVSLTAPSSVLLTLCLTARNAASSPSQAGVTSTSSIEFCLDAGPAATSAFNKCNNFFSA